MYSLSTSSCHTFAHWISLAHTTGSSSLASRNTLADAQLPTGDIITEATPTFQVQLPANPTPHLRLALPKTYRSSTMHVGVGGLDLIPY